MIEKAKILFSVFCFLFSVLLATPALAQEATPATQPADTVRERVREKIEELARKPRALVGTLTEITDSTLQIKTRSGEIKLAGTSEETLYFRVAGGSRREIKFADLVLGDFIISMGYRNGADVLETRRVITVDKSPLVERRAVYGVVQTNEKGTLTIKHPKTDEVWTIKTTAKTVVTKKVEGKIEEVEVADVAVGDRLTAAGLPVSGQKNTLTAGRIHVILPVR